MATPFPRIRTIIEKRGQLAAAPGVWTQRNITRFGPKTVLPASKTIAARFATAGEPKPKSTVTMIGTAPNGFGKSVSWAPEDAGLAVVVFLNAGDLYGVSIQGVKATDTIEFVSAIGIASFAEETENKGVGAFIGLVAAGAIVTASAFGAPELTPVIGAAEKFAESRFEQKKVKTKRRDPFGEDPGNGDKARQEGGVIVSLPRPDVTTQIYYSGNDDHQERWIKKPGTRDTAHYPDHVKEGGAFFLQSGKSNKRRVSGDGNIIIAPWDHIFEDNFGFYRLDILLKRGSGKSPVSTSNHHRS